MIILSLVLPRLLIVVTVTVLIFCPNADATNIHKDHRIIFEDRWGDYVVTDEHCLADDKVNPVIISNYVGHYYRPTLHVLCFASYPITMDFEGKLPNWVVTRHLIASANFINQTKACYVILLKSINQENFGSVGNYTCNSLQNPKRRSSIYVFENADSYSMYQRKFNVKSLQEVFLNVYNVTEFIIPCPTLAENSTDGKVHLKKYDQLTETELDPQSEFGWNTTFNPRIGFNIKIPNAKTYGNESYEIEGKYLCKLDSWSAEFQVKHSEFVALPKNDNLTFDQGQQTIECYAGDPVKLQILSTTSILNEIITNNDQDVPETYKNAGYIYYAKGIFKTNDPTAKGQIACVNETGDHLFVWNFDNAYICQCIWNSTDLNAPPQQSISVDGYDGYEFGESPAEDPLIVENHNMEWRSYSSGTVTCSNQKANFVDFNFLACGNPTECQIMSRCLKEDCSPLSENYDFKQTEMQADLKTNSKTKYLELRPGLLRCYADGHFSMSKITTDMDQNMFAFGYYLSTITSTGTLERLNSGVHCLIDFAVEQSKTPVEIQQVNYNQLFPGDKVLFACRTIVYLSFHQIFWGFEFENGSFTFPEIAKSYFPNNENYDKDGQGQAMFHPAFTSRETYFTIPFKGAKRLWCFTPMWNSTLWEKTSIELKIIDLEPAENPPNCPTNSRYSFIVMQRKTSEVLRSITMRTMAHFVDGKDVEVYGPTETVSLHCLAQFQTRWLKDGLNVSGVQSSRVNCKRNGKIYKQKLYKTTLTFAVSALNSTGNYTCELAAPFLNKQSSVYVYARETVNRIALVNEGHHYQVHHKYDSSSSSLTKWAILPCKLNSPNEIPYLFIDNTEQESTERLPLDKIFLKFDTKVGFKIDVTYPLIYKILQNNNSVLFICSEYKDGSLIGNLVSLFLIEDIKIIETTTLVPASNHSINESTTTTTLSPITTSNISVVLNGVTIQSRSSEKESNSSYVVTIVGLGLLGVACIALIFDLHRKLQIQRNLANSNTSPNSEFNFDWTKATIYDDHEPKIDSVDISEPGILNGIENESYIYSELSSKNHED